MPTNLTDQDPIINISSAVNMPALFSHRFLGVVRLFHDTTRTAPTLPYPTLPYPAVTVAGDCSQPAAAATTGEGKRLAGLEEGLARLGVSRALLIETMGEKEEETAKRLRETKEKQVSRDESASPSPWEKT